MRSVSTPSFEPVLDPQPTWHRRPPETAPVVVAPALHGMGVFATARFVAGDVIFHMEGREVTEEELETEGYTDGYPLQIGPDAYYRLAHIPEMVNHACVPNAGIRPDLTLVALRDIQIGDEITYDYSTTMLEGEDGWTMRCGCGDAACRATIGDFTDLPTESRRLYLGLDVVLAHVRSGVSNS